MDKLKQWVALTVLGCLVIVAAGWFLLISPKRADAEALRAQAAEQLAANAVLETQLTVLRAQAKDLPKKQADLARISAQIPDNPSLPNLIRALTSASASAGVEFVSIKPGAPVLPAAPAQAPATDSPPPAAAQQMPAVAPAAAAGAAGTLATIPLSLEIVGEYFDVAQFLSNLESLPRALRVLDFTVTPGGSSGDAGARTSSANDGNKLKVSLNGSVFMALNRPVATAVVAPVAAPAK